MGEVDIEAATKAARDIVFKAAEENKLQCVTSLDKPQSQTHSCDIILLRSELTPKQVRNKAEELLSLEKGTLDEGEYKKKLKAVIESAVVSTTYLTA